MLNDNDLAQVIGSTAYDNDGTKIGKVGQVFLDDQNGQPEFATVNTGLFGTSESFVPIAEATFDGEELRLPFSKDQVKDAPNVDLDGGHLGPEDEDRLFAHYGYAASPAADGYAPSQDYAAEQPAAPQAQDEARHQAPVATSGDDSMTLSEDRMQVGTTSQESGKARLRKYVTTEMETVTVPVRKEHAVLERETIADGEQVDGGVIGEEEHEVTLHEEQAVVGTTTEAVERVRLGTETSTEEETVEQELRKEHVEVDGDADVSQR